MFILYYHHHIPCYLETLYLSIVSVGYLKPFSCSQPEDYWDQSLAWTKSGWKVKWSLDETRGLWQKVYLTNWGWEWAGFACPHWWPLQRMVGYVYLFCSGWGGRVAAAGSALISFISSWVRPFIWDFMFSTNSCFSVSFQSISCDNFGTGVGFTAWGYLCLS